MSLEKLLVRSIPSGVIDWLKHLSEKNSRSLEAEARNALQEYVEARAIRESVSSRAADVGKRLTELLGKYNESYNVPRYNVSELAVLAGSDLVEPYENYFIGAVEAPVSKLKVISELLLCSPNWLIHGRGSPFIVESCRLPREPFEALEWFTEKGAVTKIYFVRCDDSTGSLSVIKTYGDENNSKVIVTPYNVSLSIGATGEGDLCCLFLILELLYKFYCKSASLFVASYIISPKQYDLLLSGNEHPLSIIKDANRSMFWEDIWDKEMSLKQSEYWVGWRELVERIYRAMESKSYIVEWHKKIDEAKY